MHHKHRAELAAEQLILARSSRTFPSSTYMHQHCPVASKFSLFYFYFFCVRTLIHVALRRSRTERSARGNFEEWRVAYGSELMRVEQKY